jgi:hypothetical protein
LPDGIPIGKMKNVREEKSAERRRFLKYTASAVVAAAARLSSSFKRVTMILPIVQIEENRARLGQSSFLNGG